MENKDPKDMTEHDLLIRIDERVEELRAKTKGLPGRVLRLEILLPIVATAVGVYLGVF